MISGWLLILVSLSYVGLLFVIAYKGDLHPGLYRRRLYRTLVYSLSLAVFCTSWTFYGAVGRASRDGLGYFTVYLGPILMLALGAPLLYRIVAIAKRQHSTSIADFIAVRYGKSATLAVLVSLVAVVGVIPYIALQLKAVAMGYNLLTQGVFAAQPEANPIWSDTALYVALLMALFTILFGTRQLDATEHHPGMMGAVAFESVVKLVALLAVGLFVCVLFFDSSSDLAFRVTTQLDLPQFAWGRTDWLTFMVHTLLAAFAIVLLPRQFQAMVVENVEPKDVKTARWLLPVYLLLTSLFVLPIAAAGSVLFSGQMVDADTYVLSLPLAQELNWLTLVAFIGGGSAATGMVIVSTIALSTMVCNEIVVPMLLSLNKQRLSRKQDLSRLLLRVRRATIVILLLLAYVYYRMTGGYATLSAIGLLSFVAVAQFAPALFGGVLWRRGNRQGAIAGLLGGSTVWCYTLLVPALAKSGYLPASLVQFGPFGIGWLKPQALFGLEAPDPITHGALWSLAVNLSLYVLVSLLSQQRLRERIQLAAFFPTPHANTELVDQTRGSATNEDLQALAERFLGVDQTRALMRLFMEESNDRLASNKPASIVFQQFVESQLAKAIGSSTARVVMDSTLKGRDMRMEDVVSIVDEASQAMQFSRELLQSALEHINMGVSVVDKDLRLVGWNQRYVDLFDYPVEFVEVGRSMEDVVRFNLSRSNLQPDRIEELVERRLQLMRAGTPHEYERVRPDGTVLLIQGNPMPGGGFVTTFSDITERRRVEIALKETNTYLEKRVEERTEALEDLNRQLLHAKAEAERANQSKTRFLASASHDLLQPLNAARLFVSALTAQTTDQPAIRENLAHIDSSLTAAEEILSSLLDISKLDAGVLEPAISDFSIEAMLRNLSTEFTAIAQSQGLELRWVPSTAIVRTDPQMLRRVVQNFLSNAVRYTRRGKVLVGCRRTPVGLRIEVWDTGPGIPDQQLRTIFEEFKRLSHGHQDSKGLGLGLAIADRIGRILKHPIQVQSTQGQGSMFAITVPYGQLEAIKEKAPATARMIGSMAGVKVLCIENDQAILEGMKALLGNWQADVLCVSNLSELPVAPDHWIPDIMLADYQLDNDDNGLDQMDSLRQRYQRNIPGILITALHDEVVKENARERGYQFMNKPIKPAGLRAMMQKLLTGK